MSERHDPKQQAKTEGARAKPGTPNPYKGVLALWWDAGRRRGASKRLPNYWRPL